MRRTLTDLAALAARLGVGGIFFANGWHKLEFGLTATSDQFTKMDAPLPGAWAATTMLIELIGGALLVAGLAVPACGLILFVEALAVFLLVSGDTGLPLTGGDINLVVALGAASVLLAVVGAGRLSVDHLVVIRRRENEAASEMAADDEADSVISSWRETTDRAPSASADHPAAKPAEPATGAKGPVTFPKEPADTRDTAELTRPRKSPRPPASATDDAAAPDPSSATDQQDRLVAGGRKTKPADSD
ncbi:DoxX family protein [Sphaerisporangium sp. TRM90804]|uniref:DoxX family protein n=1 Tax=Sphaerisporangium sp. TRM90804 TaxID=3031113 RepID=UPI0024491BE9|nr:DoxX family protein [Sphaerisporangium sp. TRM90804]MDH2428236.1 DoxX family membrane protein [Sphaerisporangium sp. TRM90804]